MGRSAEEGQGQEDETADCAPVSAAQPSDAWQFEPKWRAIEKERRWAMAAGILGGKRRVRALTYKLVLGRSSEIIDTTGGGIGAELNLAGLSGGNRSP